MRFTVVDLRRFSCSRYSLFSLWLSTFNWRRQIVSQFNGVGHIIFSFCCDFFSPTRFDSSAAATVAEPNEKCGKLSFFWLLHLAHMRRRKLWSQVLVDIDTESRNCVRATKIPKNPSNIPISFVRLQTTGNSMQAEAAAWISTVCECYSLYCLLKQNKTYFISLRKLFETFRKFDINVKQQRIPVSVDERFSDRKIKFFWLHWIYVECWHIIIWRIKFSINETFTFQSHRRYLSFEY